MISAHDVFLGRIIWMLVQKVIDLFFERIYFLKRLLRRIWMGKAILYQITNIRSRALCPGLVRCREMVAASVLSPAGTATGRAAGGGGR